MVCANYVIFILPVMKILPVIIASFPIYMISCCGHVTIIIKSRDDHVTFIYSCQVSMGWQMRYIQCYVLRARQESGELLTLLLEGLSL